MRDEAPEKADPVEVQRTIQFLSGQSNEKFAEALADNIMDPVAEETEAFRSPDLAERSLIGAKYLIDHVNTVMRTREGPEATDKQIRRRTEAFRNKVGQERRMLELIVQGLRAQQGRLPNAPNPSARALRRLKQRHLAEYQELKREEAENIAEERRAARRAQKEAARAAKQRERSLSYV